ncbi:MAG: EF-P lysine aminoacylase EpmA [Pseudomonadota bacterium]
MHWQPDCTLETAQRRAQLMQLARLYFAEQRVLEVETPMLSGSAVSDVNIDSLTVTSMLSRQPLYLHTSPEYAMKRLLAAGWPDIYQLTRVFRDGECGANHQPEFTMLEWYRHEADLQRIVDDTCKLIETLLDGTASARERALAPRRQSTYDDALRLATGSDSDASLQALRALCGDGFSASLTDDRDAMLDFLFDTHAARSFSPDSLTVITDYPASQAALAVIDTATNRALRFEIYLGSLELANGFVELRDAAEQRARFESDLERRETAGKQCPPLDEAFLSALSAGLPACAGVAVGFDRLVMLADGSRSLSDVLSFAHQPTS